jgi:hypothetical protein
MRLNLKSPVALRVSTTDGYPLTTPLASAEFMVAITTTKLAIKLISVAQFRCATTQARPFLPISFQGISYSGGDWDGAEHSP